MRFVRIIIIYAMEMVRSLNLQLNVRAERISRLDWLA